MNEAKPQGCSTVNKYRTLSLDFIDCNGYVNPHDFLLPTVRNYGIIP